MHAVDEQPETIHLYVVREEEQKPFVVLPIIGALLCLAAIVGVTVYSALYPTYQHERLTVPAQLLPPQTFTATTPVIPTGVRFYPATYAHGILTFTNGSIIGQSIPAGFTIDGVATDQAVYVPGGSADGFGKASISAHAGNPGKNGNIPPLAINQVIGSSLYIRNLSAFTGGKDAYSVKYATAQDNQTALLRAQGILLSKSSGLHYPCAESHISNVTKMVLSWRCQFVTYAIPPYMHVTGVRLVGKNVIVAVMYVPRPTPVHWAK